MTEPTVTLAPLQAAALGAWLNSTIGDATGQSPAVFDNTIHAMGALHLTAVNLDHEDPHSKNAIEAEWMDRFAVINEAGQLLDQGRHDAYGAAPLAAAAEIDSDVTAAVQLAAAFRGPANGPVRQTSPNTAMTPLGAMHRPTRTPGLER